MADTPVHDAQTYALLQQMASELDLISNNVYWCEYDIWYGFDDVKYQIDTMLVQQQELNFYVKSSVFCSGLVTGFLLWLVCWYTLKWSFFAKK